MPIDQFRYPLLVIRRVRRFWQCLKDVIQDEGLNFRLRLHFLGPLISQADKPYDIRQKLPASLLDPFAVTFRQIAPLDQFELRQLRLAQSLHHSPALLGIQTARQIDQYGEGILDGRPLLVLVVLGDDLPVLLLVVHVLRVQFKHQRQLAFHNLSNVFDQGGLALHLLREFFTQLVQVDSRQINRQSLRPVIPRPCVTMVSLTMRCSTLSNSLTSAVSLRSLSFL